MARTKTPKAILPPAEWLASLERDGYHTCNLGALADVDLIRLACEMNRLGENLAASQVFRVENTPGAPYLTLTNSAVPFHTDGAFRPEPPRYALLYCATPSTRGGATLLVRGDTAVARLDRTTRALLGRTTFQIELGNFRVQRRLIQKHPRDGSPVLLFGDPAVSEQLKMSAVGVDVPQILDKIRAVLNDSELPRYCHRWKQHDLLFFDNYRMLHARTAYRGSRLLKRVEMSAHADDMRLRL